MKWIQGTWVENGPIVLINPAYITAVDLTRKLLWAEDCSDAVSWEDDELELINKMTGRPVEEELKKNGSKKAEKKDANI